MPTGAPPLEVSLPAHHPRVAVHAPYRAPVLARKARAIRLAVVGADLAVGLVAGHVFRVNAMNPGAAVCRRRARRYAYGEGRDYRHGSASGYRSVEPWLRESLTHVVRPFRGQATYADPSSKRARAYTRSGRAPNPASAAPTGPAPRERDGGHRGRSRCSRVGSDRGPGQGQPRRRNRPTGRVPLTSTAEGQRQPLGLRDLRRHTRLWCTRDRRSTESQRGRHSRLWCIPGRCCTEC